MAAKWPDKDPDEVLDYQIDWAGSESRPGRTFGDTISSSVWTVPAGITKDSDSFAAGVTTIFLSGGVLGETYEITNHITTSGGRTMEQTMKLRMKAK